MPASPTPAGANRRVAWSPAGPMLSPASMLSLQRAAGNRSVAALIQRSGPGCGAGCACTTCQPDATEADTTVVQTDLLESAGALLNSAVTTVEGAVSSALDELGKIATCGPKLVALATGVDTAVQDLLLRHIRDRTLPSPGEAQLLLPVVEKAIIDGVCDCLTDELIAAVSLHVYLAGQPLAQKHLDHYLHGGGTPFVEDIADLFARNPTVRNNVGTQVGEVSGGGKVRTGVIEGGADLPDGTQLPGFPPITQNDWDDQDWRNAIGNVDKLQFTIVSGPDAAGNVQVQITLTDAYAWHGKEARISQCVHQALENMKAKGAADFMSTGTGVVALNLGAEFKLKDPEGPR